MYTPRSVPADNLPTFLDMEHRAIAEAMNGAVSFVLLDKLYVAPTKPREGMTVLAAGAPNWNPGAGAGVYTYYSGTWNKLG